jgi:hypothetical protein
MFSVAFIAVSADHVSARARTSQQYRDTSKPFHIPSATLGHHAKQVQRDEASSQQVQSDKGSNQQKRVAQAFCNSQDDVLRAQCKVLNDIRQNTANV